MTNLTGSSTKSGLQWEMNLPIQSGMPMQALSLLILGHNQDESEFIAMILERAGYQVRWHQVIHNAQLESINYENYDVIVSSFNTTTYNVFEALKFLNARKIYYPFIIITHKEFDEALHTHCLEQGAWDILAKRHISRLPMVVQHNMREYHLNYERDRAERAMRVSEGRFRAIFDHSPDTLIILDAQSYAILSVNPAIETSLGYTMGYVIGMNMLELIASQDNNGGNAKKLKNALKKHNHLFNFPMERINKEICWMDIIITPLDWDIGEAYMLNLRDVSQRVQTEEKLREAHRLRLEIEKEREVNTLKNNFITLASHEFRTPLTVIQASNDILKHYSDKLDEDSKIKHHDRIKRQVEHMRDLMDDVVTAGRLQSGALDLNLAQLDLVKVVDILLRQSRDHHPDHHFNYDHPDNLSMIGDEWLIRRIFNNLISNAVKYSSSGTTITIRLEAEDNDLHIQISDQGKGIMPEDLERIFIPFHRGGNIEHVGGTGLGLTITREAVELHGGTIRIESLLNMGTHVYVTLPRERPSAPTAHPDDNIGDK